MNTNTDMASKKKGLIAVIAVVLVITVLIVIIFTKNVLSTSANDDTTRQTERIKAETKTEALVSEETSATEQTTVQSEQTAAQPEQPAARPEQTIAGGADVSDENINVDNSDIISSAKAKKIALNDAGLKESQVTISRVKYEWEDGIQVYDVEFYYGGQEYEYEIDAESGTILEKDVDD